MFFFFNFHPSRSFTDYEVEVLPGEYRLVLDSDSPAFGGHGRVAPGQKFFTRAVQEGAVLRHKVSVYLPSRSALVLQRIPTGNTKIGRKITIARTTRVQRKTRVTKLSRK
jgi:1,4-alpha-glucan branching enzyme